MLLALKASVLVILLLSAIVCVLVLFNYLNNTGYTIGLFVCTDVYGNYCPMLYIHIRGVVARLTIAMEAFIQLYSHTGTISCPSMWSDL